LEQETVMALPDETNEAWVEVFLRCRECGYQWFYLQAGGAVHDEPCEECSSTDVELSYQLGDL
jgi:hypothetical protein